MRILCGLLLLASLVVAAQRPAGAFYRGESALERIEERMFDAFADPAPVYLKPPKHAEYIVSPVRHTPLLPLISDAWQSKCWPAAGKGICGVADSRHHLIAFTHHGCCVSNAVMTYANPHALGLPERDLSMLRTKNGIRIGSTAAAVSNALGAPTITRNRKSGRFEYGYFRPTTHSGSTVCGQWTQFVFDRAARAIGIMDAGGC